MKLIKLNNINKKDIPLHYRNEYSGSALFGSLQGNKDKEVSHPIEFAIERSALGKVDVQVRVLDDLDYPLVPVIKTLKTHILELDKKGLLP